MKITSVLAVICLLSSAICLSAQGLTGPQGAVTAPTIEEPKSGGLLGNIEFSAEAFGSYSVARGPLEDVLKRGFAHGKFGGGLAVNAFFGENFGVKLDSLILAIDDDDGATVDYSSASFVVRLPTSIRLDPYALVGVGRNWESERWNTHFGIGAEFNFTDKIALTGEFRHIFESRAPDYDQIRLGLRYKF